MKTCVVTGVPGWLSNRLLEGLTAGLPGLDLSGRYNVHALSLRGTDVASVERMGVKVTFGDIREPASLGPAFKGADVVVHTAGVIHPKQPNDFFAINTEGTRNVLEAALEVGARRFIYISSNSPFGFSQPTQPFTEDSPYNPYMVYGESKWQAEQLVKQASDRIETVIIRPCWFYGPGQPERQTRFFKMIQRQRVVLFGDGLNLRSMSYVDNIVQALMRLIDGPKPASQIYWIADRRPYRTLEVYWTVADLLGVPLRYLRVPSAVSRACRLVDGVLQRHDRYISEIHVAGEMDQNIACDVSRAMRELGYSPQIELEEGMRRSIEWCRRHNQLS